MSEASGPHLRRDGHRVERLPRAKPNTYKCSRCGAVADDLDEYDRHDCPGEEPA